LRQSDAARATYLKRVYGVDKESPTDYDVVINTERLTPDAAVGLILGLVHAFSADSGTCARVWRLTCRATSIIRARDQSVR
jgi:cytidylate kinase